jgi:hypothetical protein
MEVLEVQEEVGGKVGSLDKFVPFKIEKPESLFLVNFCQFITAYTVLHLTVIIVY